jgi:hypothetical protein
MIATALRSSARSAGGWTLEPASLRKAQRELGARTDRVLVGGAVSFLILMTVPAGVVGGSVIFASASWLSGPWEDAGSVLGFAIILLSPCIGMVLAIWRVVYEWSGRTKRCPFVVAYGSNRAALSKARNLGVALAVVVGLLMLWQLKA